VTVSTETDIPEALGQFRWKVAFERNGGNLHSIEVAKSNSSAFASTTTLEKSDLITVDIVTNACR
jgi:hypothetical protein